MCATRVLCSSICYPLRLIVCLLQSLQQPAVRGIEMKSIVDTAIVVDRSSSNLWRSSDGASADSARAARFGHAAGRDWTGRAGHTHGPALSGN